MALIHVIFIHNVWFLYRMSYLTSMINNGKLNNDEFKRHTSPLQTKIFDKMWSVVGCHLQICVCYVIHI